jgi:hypothetical protein
VVELLPSMCEALDSTPGRKKVFLGYETLNVSFLCVFLVSLLTSHPHPQSQILRQYSDNSVLNSPELEALLVVVWEV